MSLFQSAWWVIGFALLGTALIISLVAFILSVKGRKNPAGRGMGTAGLIISIITVTLILFGTLFFIFFRPGSEPRTTIYPDIVEKVQEAPEDAMPAYEMVEEVKDVVENAAEGLENAVEDAVNSAGDVWDGTIY